MKENLMHSDNDGNAQPAPEPRASPTWQERLPLNGRAFFTATGSEIAAARDAEITDLRAALASRAPVEPQCQWPNCLTEQAQQELAASVHGELYSGATPAIAQPANQEAK